MTETAVKNIMVVDDDPDIVTVTVLGLRRAGFGVHSFTDPAEAVDHIKQGCKACSLLISDIRMPRINGFDLVRMVRKLRPEMKVVMMTAFEVNKSEFESVFPSTPVDTVVRKPFSPTELAKMIKAAYAESKDQTTA